MKKISRQKLINVLIHTRPLLQVYTLLGLVFAMAIVVPRPSLELFWGVVGWLMLCIGITLFNSYYDKDTKPVAGLKNPPPVSSLLLWSAVALKSFSIIIAAMLSIEMLFFVSIACMLSVAYSHPRFRLKAIPIASVGFNCIAGSFTFLAIWTFQSDVPALRVYLGAISSGLFLSGIYMLMQIHQTKEDIERGYVSFASKLGSAKAVLVSMCLVTVAMLIAIYLLVTQVNMLYLLLLYGVFIVVGLYKARCWYVRAGNDDFGRMSVLTNYFSVTGLFLCMVTYLIQL